VTGGKNIPNQVLDLVQEKTDGVPLFVEELTRMLLESGIISDSKDHVDLITSFANQDIPDTLQETLLARLDHLGAVKEVVQIAAVLGREFSFELIKSVAPFEEDLLLEELDNLVEADILDRQGDYPDIIYTFRQALIQDAAYHSLLRSTRQQYHEKVAHLIEGHFPEKVKRQPEILAHHYAEAGFSIKAIELLIQAGKVALLNSANLEAIQHLKKGLRLLTKIPDSKEKKQFELVLNITLGVPLIAIKGYGAPEVGRIYQRARELSQEVGDIPSLFPALHGLYRYYLLHGSLETAFDLTELMLSWAQTAKNTEFLLEANRAMGSSLFHIGEVTTALHHLKEGVVLYDFEKHRSHSLLYGTDPKTVCLSYASLAQYVLGYPDQGLQSGRDSISWAREIAHPFSLAMALNHHAWLHQSRGEYELVEKSASELVQLSSYQEFAFWKAAGLIFMGWVLAVKDKKKGIKQMIQGIEDFRKTGANLVSPYFLSLIAETYLSMDRVGESKRFLKDAESVARENGEHFYDAEIYRLQGESVRNNPQRAEQHFKEAIKIARKQQAKSFELRAASSLARLWLQQHKTREAQKLLHDLVNWFSEGSQLTDLQKARQLIEQISQNTTNV
jgi:predicted ATPase